MQLLKCLIVTDKKVNFQEIGKIVSDYNNAFHSTIETERMNIILDIYIEHTSCINKKKSKFEIGSDVKISKYKIIFGKSKKILFHREKSL